MKARIFKTCRPICYNLDKWNIIHKPLLLITGLCGSGKTTFAQKFAKHHHAICISFDVLKFYPESSEQSQRLLKLFAKKHPEIEKYVHTRWAETDKLNSNDILFNYYCNLFFDFLFEYSQQNKKKIILEGIQIFVRLHPSKSVGMPIIIIRTSGTQSFFNKMKRDYFLHKSRKVKDTKILKKIISDLYIYYIQQRQLLNTYITYISISNKCIVDGGEKPNE